MTAATLVAADSARMAGPDDLVYCEGCREAAMALDPWLVPAGQASVCIVDLVDA